MQRDKGGWEIYALVAHTRQRNGKAQVDTNLSLVVPRGYVVTPDPHVPMKITDVSKNIQDAVTIVNSTRPDWPRQVDFRIVYRWPISLTIRARRDDDAIVSRENKITRPLRDRDEQHHVHRAFY